MWSFPRHRPLTPSMLCTPVRIQVWIRTCDELVFLCHQTNKLIDVIRVSETWSSTQKESLTNTDIEGYNIYKTKSVNLNAGIGLYVNKSVISKSFESLHFGCNEFETVWIKVDNKYDKNYFFCCAYRHPTLDVDVCTVTDPKGSFIRLRLSSFCLFFCHR